ncbi:hypothetical protein [Glycomyces tritici]|uniref:Uncharacterized protein n=1 Tax=Glycomyces tritici TaxID=2665176 RepID=A0ABT7YRJ5_9ACTN|nr:hypothetical protein [Glycomyces tritici]MDN3241267.1 hypothetical protein [Glycomyces tritici]MDN3243290.1 hypothetical protein [Glycomyces tritici]
MESFVQGIAEVVFGEASRAARRRRASAFAASLGLRFHAEGRPGDDASSGWFDELEMLGVPFVQPVADTFAGSHQGRHVLGFENLVWSKRKRRNVPHRFTAVKLVRAVPDLLVANETPAWFKPDAPCLPVPAPQGSVVSAADPGSASAVLAALRGQGPLDHSWMVRANWVIGWHRGRLRTGGANDAASALEFLTSAADACERS